MQFQSSFRAVLRAVLKQDVRVVPEQLIGTIEQFRSSFRCIFSSALLQGVSERDGASYPASSKVKLSSEFIAISTSFYSNFRAISISFQSNVRAMSEQFQTNFRAVSEQCQVSF